MKAILLALSLLPAFALGSPLIYEKHYNGFTVWLDCTEHGAIAFNYDLDTDKGHIARSGLPFKTDPTVPAACQPTSRESYRTKNVDTARTGTYDLGHFVPANHLDGNLRSITDTFYITNILPQQSTFNQSTGAWFRTEVISECYRDITKLTIWGGVIWGEDDTDDFFTASHGLKTPDYWWKLIYRHDNNDFIAWIFPNSKTAKATNIDDFIVTIKELKARLKYAPDFGVIEQFPEVKPEHSWKVSGSSILTCEGQSTPLG